MDNVQILTMDPGHGYIKGCNELGDTIRFPSAITQNNVSGVRRIGSQLDYSVRCKNKKDPLVKSVDYVVGEAALLKQNYRRLFSSTDVTPVEDYKVFAATLVSLLAPKGGDIFLVITLPIDYCESKEAEIMQAFSNLEMEVENHNLGTTTSFRIVGVEIMAQGEAAYYAVKYNMDGSEKEDLKGFFSVGLIIIGHKTTEYILIRKVMTNPLNPQLIADADTSGTLDECGMANVYSAFAKQNGQLKCFEDLINAEAGIRSFENYQAFAGVMANRDEYDSMLVNACENVTNPIGRIYSLWAHDKNKMIFLGGGGVLENCEYAKVMMEKIGNYFPEGVALLDDPQFANAKGALIAQKYGC